MADSSPELLSDIDKENYLKWKNGEITEFKYRGEYMAIDDITKQELEQANGDLEEAMYLKQPNNYRYNYSIDTGVPLEAIVDDREPYRYVANKIISASNLRSAKNFTLADAKGGQKVIVKTYQMLLLCLILIIQEILMAFIWTHQIIKLQQLENTTWIQPHSESAGVETKEYMDSKCLCLKRKE